MTYTVIKKIIYDKYRLAQLNDGIFHREDYEWEIGANIAYNFPNLMVQTDKKPTLYGITIRFNYGDPFKIELWRKVKW